MNEIGVGFKVTADVSTFERGMQQAARAGDQLGKSLAKSFEWRDVGRTLSTALGLNLQDIANKVARFVIGFSEEEEARMKELGEVGAQVSAAYAKMAAARLTDEQKYQAAILARDALEKKISSRLVVSTQDRIDQKKDELALVDKELEAQTLLAKIEQQRYEEEAKLAKWVADIKEKDAASELKWRTELASAVKDGLEKSVALDEQLFRHKLAGLGAEEKLLALEQDRDELVQTQATLVKGSIGYKEMELKIGEANLEIDQQRLDIAKQKATADDKAAKAAAAEAAARSRGPGVMSGGEGISGASDAALQEMARRDRAKLLDQQVNGGFGIGQDISTAITTMDLSRVTGELAYRNKLRGLGSSLGIDAARQAFDGDPTKFDAYYQQITNMQTEQAKTNVLLGQLYQLQKSGAPVVVVNKNTTGGP